MWAKKTEVDNQPLWLPLLTHLEDTRRTINMLFNTWLSEGQRTSIRGELSDEEAQQLVQFVGFIHDFGKATTAFQTKESYVASPSLDAELVEQLEFAGFHDVTDANITARGRSPHALAGQALLERFGVPISVAAIIGAHHGKPCDTKEKSNIIEYTANYWQHDNDANQQKLGKMCRQNFSPLPYNAVAMTRLKIFR
ncbi:CRISPR-associated endonuclease Cas3'' [Lacticaseibacillus thailandensis]|uniref:CRISPR-associated endonuclease Cas3'' n=1 Tax=Lacticaseibacillus thailandensis TaxID=381741 RepID=UPI0034E26F44